MEYKRFVQAPQEFQTLRPYIRTPTGCCASPHQPGDNPHARELSLVYTSTLPRDMRDFDHFQALVEMGVLPLGQIQGEGFTESPAQ